MIACGSILTSISIVVLQVDQIVLHREYVELRDRYEEEKECPEVCFVEQAVEELNARRSSTCPQKSGIEALKSVAGALNLPNLGCSSQESESESSSNIDNVSDIAIILFRIFN